MRRRTAKRLLRALDVGYRRNPPIHRADAIHEALGIMSRYPDVVERVICKPHKTNWWGATYRTTPVLVHQRFGDGRFWGTVSPMNTRPDYYIIMGDSRWRDSDVFYDALDYEIYDAIADQFGTADFHCDECDQDYSHENACCADEREWPALDMDSGVGWTFPCYRIERARDKRTWRRWRQSCRS